MYRPNSNEKLDKPTKFLADENNEIGYWKNIGQVIDEHLWKSEFDNMVK